MISAHTPTFHTHTRMYLVEYKCMNVYTHMQYGIFLSVKNASALLLRLASGDFCVCASACGDLPLCQYVRTHVYTGYEYLQQFSSNLLLLFLRFFCFYFMYLVMSWPSFSYFNSFCRFVSAIRLCYPSHFLHLSATELIRIVFEMWQQESERERESDQETGNQFAKP